MVTFFPPNDQPVFPSPLERLSMPHTIFSFIYLGLFLDYQASSIALPIPCFYLLILVIVNL